MDINPVNARVRDLLASRILHPDYGKASFLPYGTRWHFTESGTPVSPAVQLALHIRA